MSDIVAPEKRIGLNSLLHFEAPADRVEELLKTVPIDIPGASDEIKRFLIKQVIEMIQLEYGRYENKTKVSEELVDQLLVDAIDTHVHGASDPFERSQYEDDLGIAATKAKMKAIVIKTWYSPSASRNELAQRAVDRYAAEHGLRPAECWGGVTLNRPAGGVNADAVRKCLGFPRMKYVWMPMADSWWHQFVVFNRKNEGIRFLDEKHKPLPELTEMLRVVADNDLVLACGHYPYEEEIILFEEAKRVGVKRMEVVHPSLIHTKHTIEQMKTLAGEGIYLGLMGIASMNIRFIEGFKWWIQAIKELSDHFVLGTDSGQIQNPTHMDGLRWMIKVLMAYGVTAEEIHKMVHVNPRKHTGIGAEG
jgi:hypothetical protein